MLKHAGDRYRPDIDGLRAISVTAVVAYHVGLPVAWGGFVGVDVFFVISGFLITRLLLSELSTTGTIDVLAFYARRARRLFPAFFLVVGTTLLLGSIMLVPLKEEPNLARAARSAALYVSNFYFANKSADYFAALPDANPLLHTWSLAVEEQFYLVWPAILIALALGAKTFRLSVAHLVLATLAVIAVGSFLFCWWASLSSGAGRAAGFYYAHSRAWQLAIGALLAMGISTFANRWRLAGFILTSAGLAAILAAVSFYSPGIPYPGAAALLPCLGAAAVVAGGSAAPAAFSTQLLSLRPLVGLGKLSYSWYLWHWPLLSLARADTLGEKDLFRDTLIAIAALGLAWLTYRYVEDPIRKRRVWGSLSTRRVLGAAVCGTGCLLIIATSMISWSKAVISDPKSRYFQLALARSDTNPRKKKCHQLRRSAIAPWSDCTFPEEGAAPRVLLWGDSHADHLTPLLEAVGGRIGFSVTQRTMIACDAVNAWRNGDCLQFNSAVEEELKRQVQRGLTGVVLAGRWVKYHRGKPLSLRHRHQQLTQRDKGEPFKDTGHLAAFEQALRKRATILVSLGLRVIVVAPIPEQRYDIPLCLARRSAEDCSIERAEAVSHRSQTLKAIKRAIDGLPNVGLIDPLPALCDDKICLVKKNGTILYRDDDHLTAKGARSLLPSLAKQVSWVAATALAWEAH